MKMRFVYSILYTVLFVLALPYFLVVGLLKGKYLSSFRERLGLIPLESSQPSIWIHAVSVGEFLAAKPLIQKIRQMFPEIPVFVSTTTVTGQKLAKDFLPDGSFYFPFDWTTTVRRVFQRIQPKIVFVMETEIWPNFLWEARERKIPVILVNGRLSDRSFARYTAFARWLPKYDFCLMQSAEDARRMGKLGVSKERVQVMGNLKFDFHPPTLPLRMRKMISDWKANHLLLIAGSTMPGEEIELLEVFRKVMLKQPVKLLIAPRHPQRFSEVQELIRSRNLEFALRSKDEISTQPVLLLDSIGELAGCYEFADLVFIGGTLAPYGGHNPIEPAYFGKGIVTGPHFENFRSVFSEFQKKNAICITTNLEEAISRLLLEREARDRLGKAAHSIVEANSGAAEIALDAVREYMNAGRIVEPDQKLSVR